MTGVGAPFISVVIPTYNAAAFIDDALASVLGQTRPPDELIVVDDASTDGTYARAAACRDVRCLRLESNSGQAAALNCGIEQARGSHLAFLDADDVWLPEKLAWQLAAFEHDPTLDAVYGLVRERVVGATASGGTRDGRVLPAQLPSALLVRREAFLRVGPFDEQFRIGSVVDWYARARDAGLHMTVLPEVVYERRIHGDNVGLSRPEQRGDYLTVVRAALKRRQPAGLRR